mgnify:CR=1 FL=1
MSCREWRDVTLVLPVDRILNPEYGAEIGLFLKKKIKINYNIIDLLVILFMYISFMYKF